MLRPMTTIEHTPETVQPDSERPVFLAENGRRARILGIVAKVAFVVTALWLAALAAGMLGFGQLPGTSIEQPFNRLISGGGDAPKNQAPSADSGSDSVTASARERAARAQAIAARRSIAAGAGTSVSRSRPVRRAAPAAPAAQPVPPAAGQSAVAQQPRQQGWTRQGYVAPPGQVRQAQPPAPKPGNGYGRVKKTTPITPPPPPPPPPGNGNGNGGPKLK
jgi:hypothetical protein